MLRNERQMSSNYESIVASAEKLKDAEQEQEQEEEERETSIRLCIWKERALEKDQSTSR
jgi:hypothetical protein